MDTRHTHGNHEEGQWELLVRELKVEEESLPTAKRREAMSAQREGRSIEDGDREVVHGHALFECEKETWRAIGGTRRIRKLRNFCSVADFGRGMLLRLTEDDRLVV
jgi:hypothetical protein